MCEAGGGIVEYTGHLRMSRSAMQGKSQNTQGIAEVQASTGGGSKKNRERREHASAARAGARRRKSYTKL